MAELIEVHFVESSFANRQSKEIAILVDVKKLFPAGIFKKHEKKLEKI
jgi:hypothetical protein